MSEASTSTDRDKLSTQIVSTTIENLVKTFVFGPDCTVDNVLPGGDLTLQAQVPLHQFRLTAINDKTVVDSGELKSTLLEYAANGQTNITVTFAPTTMKEAKVQIEDSVMCNGAPSTVRAESKEAVIEMLKQIQDTPNNSVCNSRAATPKHASRSAKETRNGVMHPEQSGNNNNNNNNTNDKVSAHWQEERKITSPRSHRRKVSASEHVLDEMRSASCETIGSGNSSDSEVSVEFNSVQFSPINRRPISHALRETSNNAGAAATGQMQLEMSPRLPGSSVSPTLLEFDKMGLSLRAEDATRLAAAHSPIANPNRKESSVRSRLARALEKVKPLNCVICITQDVNPIAEIELLAMSMHKQIIAIDLGVKLRLRPRFEVFATEFKEAMRLGAWFVLVNAHKSMSSCQHLEELVHELREEIESTNSTSPSPQSTSMPVSENAINNSSISRESKIIISLEPHPHFPRGLVEGAVVIKLTSSFDNSAILSESMATCSMRNRLVTADTLSASQLGTLIRQPITTTTFGKDNKCQHKKRVRISAAVDIVDIPPREALRMNANATSNSDRDSSASATSSSSSSSSSSSLFSQTGDSNYYHNNNNNNKGNNNNNSNIRSGRGRSSSGSGSGSSNGSCSPIDVSGTVALMKSFMGVPGDKFLCVQRAGEIGRFAVGSSLGNLYFLDSLGNSLLQAHAHNASIWDVTFADKYHFATGCEDGTAASWQLASATETELPIENKEHTTPSYSSNNTNANTNCSECKADKPCATDSSSSVTPSSLMGDEIDAGIVPTAATSLGDDVYCVSYVNGATHFTELPPLVIGGLHSAVVIRSAHSSSVSLVPITSNAQVADSFPSYSVSLVGGGDGSITVIDVATASVMATLQEHSRKVPALTVCNDHVFFSGAFDSSILSWDVRLPRGVAGNVAVPQSVISSSSSSSSTTTESTTNTSFSAHTLHTLKLKNYVTGLSVDHNHLAATVGENLYLWDVRNLNTVLGGYPQGWKGLTRGIKVQSTDHIVVTGSQDGQVRFWTFV